MDKPVLKSVMKTIKSYLAKGKLFVKYKYFVKEHDPSGDLRLDFGCGENPREGFVGVDLRDLPSVKYVCAAWEIDKHVEAVVTEIYSRHFIEHLTFSQLDLTLRAWKKILVPGGKVQIIVPDMRYHIGQFLDTESSRPSKANPEWTVLEHAIAGFWGWQREGDEKMWDVHKSGYDFRLINMKLAEHGFCDIHRVEDEEYNLNVKCLKPK